MWQGQRDSNPQPTVLETVALSIALCPYLFDGSHHPCDLYIITNLFGNCKGGLQIFLKKILVQSSGASGKRRNGSCKVNGVVRCVIKAPHGHTVFFQTEIPLHLLNFAPSPISTSYPRRCEIFAIRNHLIYAVAFSMNMLSIFLPPISLALKP